MIRFGPAGIPLSCKGRTLKDGIEDVHNLGLNAMEIQMVRVNIVERPPEDEEVGLTPMEVENDLVVGILRKKGKKEIQIIDPYEKIKADDTLVTLTSGLAQNFQELTILGRMGEELDVQLSMHTPYYMDLVSNTEMTEKSISSIKWAATMTNIMDGLIVVTHTGLYGEIGKKKAKENIAVNLSQVMDWWKNHELRPILGLETSGRQEVFGSLDEILDLCDEIDGIVPVVNFAHLHARENGILREPQDFAEVFDRTNRYVDGCHYVHFAGVEHEGGNEKRITPIKKGDLRFEPLAEFLVENMPNVTIISSSPLLEHDAMYMKVIFERALMKKVTKGSKVKKNDREEKD